MRREHGRPPARPGCSSKPGTSEGAAATASPALDWRHKAGGRWAGFLFDKLAPPAVGFKPVAGADGPWPGSSNKVGGYGWIGKRAAPKPGAVASAQAWAPMEFNTGRFPIAQRPRPGSPSVWTAGRPSLPLPRELPKAATGLVGPDDTGRTCETSGRLVVRRRRNTPPFIRHVGHFFT